MRDKLKLMLLVCAFFPTLCVRAAEVATTNGVKSAAERGDAAAQFRYAEMLRDGSGVKKDVLESAVWTRKAAEGGLAAAKRLPKEFGVVVD